MLHVRSPFDGLPLRLAPGQSVHCAISLLRPDRAMMQPAPNATKDPQAPELWRHQVCGPRQQIPWPRESLSRTTVHAQRLCLEGADQAAARRNPDYAVRLAEAVRSRRIE